MAILVEGFIIVKSFKKLSFQGNLISTTIAISPMFFKQIEKFQCLKLSTAQGPAHGTLRRHVACVMCPQTCLEVSQLFCPKSPKTLHD